MMRPSTSRAVTHGAAVAAALLLAARAAAQAPTLRVSGLVAAERALTLADLQALPPLSLIAAPQHGERARYTGARLADVLGLAGVQLGPALRGPRLGEYVLVEAADGYRVIFTLAELDSAFTATKEVALVWEQDGRPLPAQDGPFRLVVPDERRAARWVRQVTGLVVRRAE